MNSSGSPVDYAALRVARIFAAQRAAFDADPDPSASRRRARIKALKRQISRYQDVLADAMSRDFGFRAPTESKMLDLLGSTLEANHAIAHLKRWMKPTTALPICYKRRVWPSWWMTKRTSAGSVSLSNRRPTWVQLKTTCRAFAQIHDPPTD